MMNGKEPVLQVKSIRNVPLIGQSVPLGPTKYDEVVQRRQYQLNLKRQRAEEAQQRREKIRRDHRLMDEAERNKRRE